MRVGGKTSIDAQEAVIRLLQQIISAAPLTGQPNEEYPDGPRRGLVQSLKVLLYRARRHAVSLLNAVVHRESER